MVHGSIALMTRHSDDRNAPEPLLEEAADWVVRLVSGDATQEDAENLARWRETSPAHEAAFREVAGVRAYARVAKSTRPPMSRRAVLAGGGATAVAVIAGVGLARPPLGLWPSFAELMADHRTPVGGRYAFAPRDGVDVELSSRTSVSLIGNGDGITLIAGQAFVSASAQDRPFFVRASDIRAQASEAEFNVQSLATMTRLICVTGELVCEVAGQRLAVAADQAVTLTAAGEVRRDRVDGRREAAWRRGQLIFEGAPLAEVVDQINLYRSGRVVLNDASLGVLPVNAVFHTNQMDAAVPQLEQLLGIRARSMGAGVVLLG